MTKYKFVVGIAELRTVEVEAVGYLEAVDLAKAKLDEECEETGDEAPVAWDLRWIKS